jgi:hypothetical protein
MLLDVVARLGDLISIASMYIEFCGGRTSRRDE